MNLQSLNDQELEASFHPPSEHQRIKTQKDESKRIEATFSKAQFEKYEKVRDLLAHKHLQRKGTQAFNDVLETMFDEILLQNKSKESKAQASQKIQVSQNDLGMTSRNSETLTSCSSAAMKNASTIAAATTSPEAPWHCLTPKRKRQILEQDQCCQHITDLGTGEVCGSKFNLHIDHITPKHAGGTNAPSNLRVLCRAHNLYRELARGQKYDPSRDCEILVAHH
jgi:hypothetical protein